MKHENVRCRVCDSGNLKLIMDFGEQPWCGNFLREDEVGSEEYYPLRLVYCSDCATPQLDYTVPKEVMFSDHTYLSGVTRTLSEHFSEVAADVDRRFFGGVGGKSVLDIGSNDGTQLRSYKGLGYDVLGVESSLRIAKIANGSGIPTVNEFFNLESARRLDRRFHVINASGVLFHLEELHCALEGIREALRDDGILVVQFLYMKRIVENVAFDQIYHEHLLYYNLRNIERLLGLHGLSMFDARLSPIHGGSIIGYCCHNGRREPTKGLDSLRRSEDDSGVNDYESYLRFAKAVESKRRQNIEYLQKAKESGKRVFGLGAPAKGNTLLNYFRIGTDNIECLVEKNPMRSGLYSPGMHIPVILETDVEEQPDIYYVLAWNFRDEILKGNERLIKDGVEFYFPIEPMLF
jgi:SAM-dependent methyltransferase